MKNKILLLVILSMLAGMATAQQKSMDWSFKLYGGYGIVQPGADLVTAISPVTGATSNNQSYTYKNFVYNFGQSPHFGAGASLKLTDGISVGLDLDYLTGSRNPAAFAAGQELTGYTASYHALTLVPNASIRLFKLSGTDIYNTIGLVAGVNTKLDINLTGSDGDDQQYHYGLSFGFKDAVGIKFSVAPHIHIFGELAGFFFAPQPTTRVFPSINGGPTTVQTFKNSGQVNDIVSATGETYNEQSETPYHFSSIGLNVGVTFDLKK